MKMPPPIATKFTKLVLTILAITILGIILSFVSQDHTLLMLSAGVAVAGGVKIIDYLDVKYRLLWFRLHHPNGKIDPELIRVDEKNAIVCCRIYADTNEPLKN